ncbi:MAG TPA: RNA polymerase sigma factor [Methylophilaceae bacterium]|nr:RNA polymerase sigma factor [Methylophilaceae bacterium]
MDIPASHLSDTEIVRRILANEESAFELLMRRYNRPLYRTARSILKDDAEAEDALQEAYILAYRALGKFRGESALSTWLTRIVVNESIARSRKTTRRAEIIQLGAEPGLDYNPGEDAMNNSRPEEPEQAVLRSEARRFLERKIDDLPSSFRTVFILRAMEEMSVEETAFCLDIPEATVRTRYFRARGMLREALSREIDYAFEDAFSFDGARCDRIVAATLSRLRFILAAASAEST